MFKSQLVRMVVIAVLILGMVTQVRSQGGNQGSIEGTVVDQNGGAIANASVTARNTATNTPYTTTTDTGGFFRFPLVLVGPYELTVEGQGFSTLTRKDVQVTVGARINLSLTLPLAGQQQQVQVSAEVPVVETTRSQVSTTVNSQSVANLPVLGRNFIDFVLLTPGVTRDTRGGDISFAGQRGTLNSLVVDGSDNNNTFFGQTLGRTGTGRAPYQFSQDAVAEFQVNSNSYSAEYGRAGGAVINVVTKSGTNDWHGTAFEFYRDTSLNAQDSITKSRKLPKAPLHFNQFGGNLGGPVLRDKLFFFFDYDGQRNTLPNTVFLLFPPGFPGRPLTPAEQDALAYLTPRAQSWTRTQNQNVYLGKVDWHISQKHLLSGRINSQRFTGANFENGGSQNSLEHTGTSLVTTDTASARLTSSLTDRLVNVASFSYVRDDEPGLANSSNPEAVVRQVGAPVLVVGRNFFSPRFTNIRRQQWGDSLNWVRGPHTFKFGVDFIRDQIANFFPGNFSGSFNFASLEAFGRNLQGKAQANPATDATLAQAFAGTGTTGPTTNPNLFETSFFAQDEWRASRSFTLNLGVRYDYQRVDQPTTRNPTLSTAGFDTSRIPNPRNSPEPRVGIAWSPTSRLVVRAGYGIFYGRTPSILYGTAMSNNGINVATLGFSGSDVPKYPNNKCGAPGTTCAAPTGGKPNPPTIFVFDKNYRQPFVQQWSLGLEHALGRDFSVGVSYLGVKGTHIQRTRDVNLNPVLNTSTILVNDGGGAPLRSVNYLTYSAVRPIAGFNRILQFEGTANSIYHGLILQLSKRMSRGFQFAGAYTLGKVIDDNPDATAVVPGSFDDAKMVQFPTMLRADRGPGQNDQRHRFVLSGIWNLDTYAQGLSGVPRFLLGYWEFSGIFAIQSGQPYSALVAGDLNTTGNSRTARFPGVGRDTFYLPRNSSFDPRITKDLPISERAKFQLILEAFNVFNANNVFAVNTNQYALTSCSVPGPPPGKASCLNRSTTFGLPTSNFNTALAPRILQLGAKFIF